MQIGEYYKKHKLATLIVAGAAVVLIGYYWLHRDSATPQYLLGEVKQGSISATVQATGTINPLTTVPVGSYVSGTVQYIFADFNTRVQADQVLAQIDPAIYEAAVITARGNLANAQANLLNLQASVNSAKATIASNQANVEKAKADLDYARASARRTSDLMTQGIDSVDSNDLAQSTLGQKVAALDFAEAQVNQSNAQLAQTEAQVQQAKAQVVSAQGALDQAETNLRYTTITSPIDGIVVARNVDVGQSVAAALQAPNVFTIAQDLKRMEVYASTDESDTGNIKVGTAVTFQVDAFPTELFHGRVSAIRLNATTVQNVVTYDTIIDFDNPDEKLLPGETAYVTIPTGYVKDTLKIPNTALTFTPELSRTQLQALYNQYHIPAEATTTHLGGWQIVWKEDSKGNPYPVAFKAGITDYSFVQVISGNLKEGDKVITGLQVAGMGASGNRPPSMGGAHR